MGVKQAPRDLPARLEDGRRRFERWRRTRKKVRGRIPEPLWALAVELAGTYGIHRTAKALSLDYYALKRRVEEEPAPKRRRRRSSAIKSSKAPSPTGTTFVELSAPPWPGGGECVLELEDPGGAKMRVHLKGFAAPDLAALSRGFWNPTS